MLKDKCIQSLEVVHWDEYQRGRRSGERYHWFSLSNTVHIDSKLFEFSVEEKWLWICVLSQVSWEGKNPLQINLTHWAQLWNIPVKKIEAALCKFENTGLIKCLTKHAPTCDGTCARIYRPHNTIQNNTGQSGTPIDAPSLSKQTKKDKKTSEEITSIWNELVQGSSLPSLRSCSKSRKRLATIRWGENPSAEFWRDVIKRILASPFCTGSNTRGWCANIDFLLRPDTAARVLEGQFDGRAKGADAPKFERN